MGAISAHFYAWMEMMAGRREPMSSEGGGAEGSGRRERWSALALSVDRLISVMREGKQRPASW